MTTGYPDDWDRRRKRVLERDHYQCLACGATGGPRGETELHVDHVRPKARGGGHGLGNLQTLCQRCHSEKHGFEIGGEENVGGDGPVGLGTRLGRLFHTTAASAALGATQLLATWVLATTPTSHPRGTGITVLAVLIVVGVVEGIEWRPGRVPGFAVGVCLSVVVLQPIDAVALGGPLADLTVFVDVGRYLSDSVDVLVPT